MTDLSQDIEKLGFNDLVEIAEAAGIDVTEEDNRDSLLEQLQPE